MEQEYTVQDHAEGLLQMLELRSPCDRCPASDDPSKRFRRLIFDTQPCEICREFVGHPKAANCPCYLFDSRREAIKATWLALEAGGFLED